MGRFFNVDPLSEKYAYQSHYNFSENRMVDGRELEGLERWDPRWSENYVGEGGFWDDVNNILRGNWTLFSSDNGSSSRGHDNSSSNKNRAEVGEITSSFVDDSYDNLAQENINQGYAPPIAIPIGGFSSGTTSVGTVAGLSTSTIFFSALAAFTLNGDAAIDIPADKPENLNNLYLYRNMRSMGTLPQLGNNSLNTLGVRSKCKSP